MPLVGFCLDSRSAFFSPPIYYWGLQELEEKERKLRTGLGGAGGRGRESDLFFQAGLEGWCLTSGVQPSPYYPRWRTKKKQEGAGR